MTAHAEHIARLEKLRAFAQSQITFCKALFPHHEQQLLTCDAYNARYHKREIDRLTERIAMFEPDVAALTWAIEQLKEPTI